jgi:pimeloyl-ACP methyl ester carboxylesterase
MRIDVGGGNRTAVDVYRPAELPARPVVAFAFPGGGYGRRYYDIRHDGDSYSQAAFHLARDWIVVTCDHLGVGESDQPDPSTLTIEALADANDATVGGVLDQLGVTPGLVLGMGQSMGGCLSVVTQARRRPFDALAVLGYSAIHTVLPSPAGGIRVSAIERGSTRAEDRERTTAEIGSIDAFRWAFHADDTDPALVAADLAGGYPMRTTAPHWGSVSLPPAAASMMTAGVIADEAAAVDVPVFVATGARDVVPDPRAEPGAYPASDDITVVVVPGMAHMHNFAPTRARLWQRLHGWGESLRNAG